jgi:ATP diphosphatase
VLDKLEEEIAEVRAEFAAGADHARMLDEIGDVLFVLVNLARHARVDFSQALRHANAKFERRFRRMEALAAGAGEGLAGKSLDEQDALWNQAKAEERRG